MALIREERHAKLRQGVAKLRTDAPSEAGRRVGFIVSAFSGARKYGRLRFLLEALPEPPIQEFRNPDDPPRFGGHDALGDIDPAHGIDKRDKLASEFLQSEDETGS